MSRGIRPAKQALRTGDAGTGGAGLDELKRAVFAQCNEEFQADWREPFHSDGGPGRAARLLIGFFEADELNKHAETQARALLVKIQARLKRVADDSPRVQECLAQIAVDVAEFRAQHHLVDGAGGAACCVLATMAILAQGGVSTAALTQLPGVTETEAECPLLVQRDKRTALVARYRRAVPWLEGFPTLSNRQLAVLSILCCVGPNDWSQYEGWATVARVIEDEATRVRNIRNALAKEPTQSG